MHNPPFFAAALFAKPLAPRLTGCCAALLWLSSLAVPNVRAQNTASLTTVATFTDATGKPNSTGAISNQALTVGPDGNLLYGTAPAGGANNNTTDNGGTFFSVPPGGNTITLIRSLSSTRNGSPNSKLLLANDGNFYGTTVPTTTTNQVGTVFQITPAGGLTTEHTFSNAATDGTTPVGGLIQGLDGALYGVTQLGGLSTPANPGGDGTVYKLVPGGAFTQLHQFSFRQDGVEGSAPNSALVQGSDAYFYGVTAAGGTNGVGVIYRMTSDGILVDGTGTAAKYLYSFTGGTGDGGNPVGPLIEGSPGVYYGITTTGGVSGAGTFFSISYRGGSPTTLHNFTSTELNSQTPSGLIKAQDGNFYVTTGAGSTTATTGAVVQITPTGNASQIIKSTTSSLSALVQANDGNFYGTTPKGGVSGDGTVFRLVIQLPPTFFNGEVALANNVYYLSFPAGNYFGYYTFLTDAHYIYHFDLGYEYVFDAADGQNGVYLYDFTSSVFFYTNPAVFPYLYDFTLKAELYYYPNPNTPGRYNTNGTRYFFKFNADGKTGQVITNPATGT